MAKMAATKNAINKAVHAEMDSLVSEGRLDIGHGLCRMFTCKKCPWGLFHGMGCLGATYVWNRDEMILGLCFLEAVSEDFSEER